MDCLSPSLMVFFEVPPTSASAHSLGRSSSFLVYSSFSPALWAFALFWGYRNWLFPASQGFSPCVPNRLSPSQHADLHPDCGCPRGWGFLRLCAKLWPQSHGMSVDKGREDHHTLGVHCILSTLHNRITSPKQCQRH